MTPTKTAFAGYEVLQPGDPLSSDGQAFTALDPLIADRLAKIGAITHRHDGHAALVNPTTTPVITPAATGGTLPAATPIYVTYTLVDADGGETLPVAAVQFTTPGGFLDPATSPTLTPSTAAGTLLAGNYTYAVSVTDGVGGETIQSPAASITIAPGAANNEVTISGLTAIVDAASGSSVTAGWRLWRSQGGGPWYLIGTGSEATDTFLDNGVAGDCTVLPQTGDTTRGTGKATIVVPSAGQPSGVVNFCVYLSTDGSFTSPALLGVFPAASFDTNIVLTDLSVVASGAPPVVTRSFGGANPIDALTQLINLIKVPMTTSPNSPVTGDYTLQLTDLGTVLEYNSNANHVFTIPPNASVNFPVGAVIEVFMLAAGQVTFAPGAGVTILTPGGRLHSGEQYATIGLRQRATNVWVLSGDLV